MMPNFREALATFQDPRSGHKIISLPAKSVLWYWTKFLVFFSFFPFFIFLAVITYYVPQLPRLALDNLPSAAVTLQSKHLSTTLKTPYTWGNRDFSVTLDPAGTESELDTISAGILFTRDQALVKDNSGQITSQAYSGPDFTLTRTDLVNWLTSHSLAIWFSLVVILVLVSLLSLAFVWLVYCFTFAFWGLILWLLAKPLHRPLAYPGAFKLAVYASVFPLLIAMITLIAPNQLISLIGFGLFIFSSFSWLNHLPQS